MTSVLNKLSYSRLRNESTFEEEAEEVKAFKKIRSWYKIKKLTGRRRPRVQIPGLIKLLRSKIFSKLRVSWFKALRRLKNGQSHMNDLFGGNYLVMQVNPGPFTCGRKPYMGHGLYGLPSSRYSLGKSA